MAKQILGSYRKDDFADPDSFLVQLGMVLERYDDKTVREASSPLTGIQRTCKFPPSIAEVSEFCEELKRRATYPSQWSEQARRQIAEREQLERLDKSETSEHRAGVVARIKSEMRGKGFQFDSEREKPASTFRQFTAEELEAMYGTARV